MSKGPITVPILIGGVPSSITISDNIEDFPCRPGAVKVLDAVCKGTCHIYRASAATPNQTCIGIVIGMVEDQCQVLTQGLVQNYGIDLVPSALYYLSAKSGQLTTTPSVKVGHRIQAIGIALSETDLLVNPNLQRFVVVGQADSDKRLGVYWNSEAHQFELG